MHRSTPGLPVHHKLLESTQTHAHWVSDAIQPPHSLSPPSPPAPNPYQHQGLFQWVNSLHEVAKVLELCLHRAKKCGNFLIMPSSPSFLKFFLFIKLIYFSYCCSVNQLIQTFYNPMDCSMPGVLHYLPESAQTHVRWVNDVIQPYHPLSLPSPCPPSFPASESFPMTLLFASGGQSIYF